ncbi:hypothetical protein BC833DRAFT_591270 [Globomyces pollinis-pini]|nr:hypothetical protein BC833DRAFT_591270 [Globomyces pollinis-pini]
MKMGFNHCFGAFACIDPSDPQAIQQGKNCVDAAKFTRLEHFIWSTMDSDSSVDHFETLSEINKYLKDSEVPRTSIYPSITYESAIESLIVKKDGESAELILPVDEDVKLPFYSIADTGAWVSILFEHTQIYIDKDVDICSEYVSLKEIGQKMKEQFPELKLTQSDTKINDPKSLESKCFEYFATQNQTAGLRDCQSARRMYPKATDLSKFLKGIKI